MKKNGCVANVFSGIISIFVAIFLFFIAILFCLISFLPEVIQDLSLDFLSYFEGFVESLTNATENILSSLLDVYALHNIIVGVLAGLIFILAIVYMIGGIKQIKISKFSLEGYKDKKGIIARYAIFELIFGALLLASTVMNIVDVTVFALVVLFNCVLKMLICMMIAHSIRKGRVSAASVQVGENEGQFRREDIILKPPEAPVAPTAQSQPQQRLQGDTLSTELSKLVTLKVQGVITEEEYNARRIELERRYGNK